MKRAITIQKAVSVARDKRMQVINELVGAVSEIHVFLNVSLLLTVLSCFTKNSHIFLLDRIIGQVYKIFCLGGKMDSTCA